jgi:Cft2 family RNA processing exonuclease
VWRIDAVVLSHAHIDHAGRIPLLVREGYRGTVWCTAATRDLAAVMLADSAHIQEKGAEFLTRHHKDAVPPLYSMVDATRAAELMAGVPYHKTFDVTTGVQVTFVDAGHILGSASVVLDFEEGGRSQRLELQDTGVDLDYVVVSTEHLFLGLIRGSQGGAGELLRGRLLSLEAARGVLLRLKYPA